MAKEYNEKNWRFNSPVMEKKAAKEIASVFSLKFKY